MTIDTDLATLRDELAWQLDYGNRASEHLQDFEEALDRVEAELARLRDVADQRLREGVRQRHRADVAERELARLQDGLRPESLARLFHETYERLAPDHGYKTREDSAVRWEDVPAVNKALMIGTADAVARALLAEDGAAKQRHGRGCGCTPCKAEDWDAIDAGLRDGAA